MSEMDMNNELGTRLLTAVADYERIDPGPYRHDRHAQLTAIAEAITALVITYGFTVKQAINRTTRDGDALNTYLHKVLAK